MWRLTRREGTAARTPSSADPIRQEAVAAFVEVDDGFQQSGELRVELQSFVKAELSPYKYPRILEFLAEIPRDHVGKVQPKLVRERALQDRNLS